MKYSAVFAILLTSPCFAQSTVDSIPQNLVNLYVGVRIDAPPFSYKPEMMLVSPGRGTGPLGDKGYAGYMVYVCDRVLEVMQDRSEVNFDVTVVEVSAENRFELLKNDSSITHHSIDILCDPSTATRERLRDHTASFPLYLSGIGYSAKKPEKNRKVSNIPRIAVVGSTTAGDYGITRILDAGEWPNFREHLLSYLYNPEGAIGNDKHAAIQVFPSHKAAVEAFCGIKPKGVPSDPSDPLLINYYVGDLEIVNRALLLYGNSNCNAEPAETTFSDDRYVIFMRNSDDLESSKAQLLMLFSRTLSEMVLSQPSLLDEAFNASFEGYKRSDKLKLFFWSLYGP